MKVGDLVKLKDDPRVHMDWSDVGSESLGIIVEADEPWHADKGPGRHGWRWVKWSGNPDWDCMYIEDIEVISGNW